jgi:peroxiredoxin
VTPAVARPAPDFVTRNQHGEQVGLKDLRGRRAVIVFYPWAFSSICRGELAALRDDHEKLRDLEVRVVAVSCDAMFTLRAYADAEHIGFDLLSDHWPHGRIAKAYGVFDDQAGCALRGTFVLDAAGRISWQQVNGIGESRDFGGLLSLLSTSIEAEPAPRLAR